MVNYNIFLERQVILCIRHLSNSDAAYIPIIAMTANAFDEDIEKSKVAGMYVIGILATILILLVQIIFHKQYRWIPTVWESWLI